MSDSVPERLIHTNGSVQAIVYNEGYGGILEEVYEDFQSQIKIIAQYSIESNTDSAVLGKAEEVNVEDETFNIYISGIDVYGPVSTKSRSDVNIIATVNPTTKQILLTNTPRDYYVVIPGVSGSTKDKLTHAGIYGVESSMATLENLYDIDIPFYARVNFTSLITLVDAMGGVDVNSEFAFTTSGEGGAVMNVQKGLNHFDGKQALAFSRERYNLAGGDNQRGKNQEAVLTAILQKAMSPALLANASELITSVSDCVETNMTRTEMAKFINMQLSDAESWEIESTAATGTGDSQACYSSGSQLLYVMWPDEASVAEISEKMQQVLSGQ